MGMCLDNHGHVAIEIRRESFVLCFGIDNDKVIASVGTHTAAVEMDLDQLLNIKSAVDEAVRYCKEKDIELKKDEVSGN